MKQKLFMSLCLTTLPSTTQACQDNNNTASEGFNPSAYPQTEPWETELPWLWGEEPCDSQLMLQGPPSPEPAILTERPKDSNSWNHLTSSSSPPITSPESLRKQAVEAYKAISQELGRLSKQLSATSNTSKPNQFDHAIPDMLPTTTHESKQFECSKCDQCFSSNSNLRRHERSHIGEKPYQCKTCHKPFLRKDDLKRHENSHMGKKRFKCQICHAKFSLKHNLKTHVYTHNNQNHFKCTACPTTFSRLSSLKRHRLIHSAESASFKCPICPKTFARKDHLNQHEHTHN